MSRVRYSIRGIVPASTAENGRGTMGTILGEGTIQELRESILGEVITPADPRYDEARAVWNGMIDKRPALIVRCSGVADVIAAVQFAHSQDLELAVRGGGHNLHGLSPSGGGLVAAGGRVHAC